MHLTTTTLGLLPAKPGQHRAGRIDHPGKPLEHLNHAFHVLGLVGWTGTTGALLGIGIGWLSARQLGARFDWAALWLAPLALAIGLVWVGVLGGDAAIGSIAMLSCTFGGHLVTGVLTHGSDRRAGDDRAHDAGERIGPHNLLLRRTATRRLDRVQRDELAIGVTRRGRIAKIKRGDQSGSHSLILGATGAGKTTLLGLMASEYARSGHGVVLVEAKTDPDLEAEARRAAAAVGRPFVLVSPDGPVVWDLLATGGVDETVAKLLACEVYTEPHFKSEAVRLLRWVVRAMHGCDTPMTLPEVLRLCAPDRLAAHASKHGSPELAGQVGDFVKSMTAQERSDVAGLRSRLAVLAESDYGRSWLDPDSGAGPVLDLSEAIRRRAVVYFRLDSERLGVVAEKVGASIAIELGAIASELQGRPIPTFVGIDEYGAIESEQIDSLYARARGAGFSVAVATHTLADLRAAGEAVEDRVKATIDSVLCLRVGPDDADAVVRLAGQVGEWKSTNRTRGPARDPGRSRNPDARIPASGPPRGPAAPGLGGGHGDPPRSNQGRSRRHRPGRSDVGQKHPSKRKGTRMRLKEWQLEHMLRTTAMLVTYYLDRERPPAYDLFHVTHGPARIPYATEALCRYVMEGREEVLGEDAVLWVDRKYEEALELARDASDFTDRTPQG